MKQKKTKPLEMDIYCHECKIECVTTETGILCPACGGYISDEDMENK